MDVFFAGVTDCLAGVDHQNSVDAQCSPVRATKAGAHSGWRALPRHVHAPRPHLRVKARLDGTPVIMFSSVFPQERIYSTL